MAQERNSFSLNRMRALASKMTTTAVSLNDFQMLSPDVARVIVTASNTRCTQDEMVTAVSRCLKTGFTPVLKSFRPIPGAQTASFTGFVARNRQVVLQTDERYSKMRPVTASIMLDPSDGSQWNVHQENGQTFLLSSNEEDMSHLLTACMVREVGVSKLREIAHVSNVGEFVAYVNLKGDLKHGFVLAAVDGNLEVANGVEETAEVIPETSVVEVAVLDEDELTQITASVGLESKNFDSRSKASMLEFYQNVFGYAPGYVEDIKKTMESHAAM